MVGRWKVTRVSTSLGKKGEKEIRKGDEEVVSAGGFTVNTLATVCQHKMLKQNAFALKNLN